MIELGFLAALHAVIAGFDSQILHQIVVVPELVYGSVVKAHMDGIVNGK